MKLTADRWEVSEGERVAATLIVTPSRLAVQAAGGLASLRHQLEDVGFASVALYDARPPSWPSRPSVPTPGDLEWLAWFEGQAVRSASFQRELTSDLRVVDAWPVAAAKGKPLSPRMPVGNLIVLAALAMGLSVVLMVTREAWHHVD